MVERAGGKASERQLADSSVRSPETGAGTPQPGQPATAKDAVVGWLTEFDSPIAARARERRVDRRVVPRVRVPRTPLRVRWSTIVAVLAGIGAAAFAIATVDPREETAPVPAQSSPPASAPPPSPSGAPPRAPVDSLVPDDCGEFFSARMEKRMKSHDLRLFDPDSLAEASLTLPRGRSVGTGDTRLGRMLAGIATTECYWLDSENPRTAGVLTAVGEGRDRQLQLARARLDKLGLTRLEEDGGIRYFEETVGADGVPTGESHFFRGGVWFATEWYGYGPRGYSADMADSLLGKR